MKKLSFAAPILAASLLSGLAVTAVLFGSISTRTVAIASTEAGVAGSPELVVHLLDYLANDYGRAVQNGSVVSKSEYEEQLEFAEIVKSNAISSSRLSGDAEFTAGIEKLRGLIDSKSSADDVAKLARQLQQDAIRIAGIDVSPTAWPDLAKGNELYRTNCLVCHGAEGRGDGVAGKALDPAPSNFHDAELVENSAPYKFFNTIRFGVPGTAMAAFPHLSDTDVWNLAFYLKSLPYLDRNGNGDTGNEDGSASGGTISGDVPSVTLRELATLSDAKLRERLKEASPQAFSVERLSAAIGALRARPGQLRQQDPLETAVALLGQSLAFAKAGDHASASSHAVRAYLEGIEPVEPKLRANIPGSVEEIEALMAGFRSALQQRASHAELERHHNAISARLSSYRERFMDARMSPGMAFGAAFTIFLREGFEAVLLIVILISVLRGMGQGQAVRYVHIGWMAAVAVGIVAWFASGALLAMGGMSREVMEGAISLVAVGVLIYVGFWLHRHSEAKKWRTFLEAKLKHGMSSGSYAVLALVAFMAVFREAFEVVLFLRAIWIDLDGAGQTIASAGVLSSGAVLAGLSYAVVRQSRKLPLTALFRVCSWTMVLLAIVLAGKGMHALQEAGLVGVTPSATPLRFELFGVYPSWQTLGFQALVAAVFLGLFWSERKPAVLAKT